MLPCQCQEASSSRPGSADGLCCVTLPLIVSHLFGSKNPYNFIESLLCCDYCGRYSMYSQTCSQVVSLALWTQSKHSLGELLLTAGSVISHAIHCNSALHCSRCPSLLKLFLHAVCDHPLIHLSQPSPSFPIECLRSFQYKCEWHSSGPSLLHPSPLLFIVILLNLPEPGPSPVLCTYICTVHVCVPSVQAIKVTVCVTSCMIHI